MPSQQTGFDSSQLPPPPPLQQFTMEEKEHLLHQMIERVTKSGLAEDKIRARFNLDSNEDVPDAMLRLLIEILKTFSPE